ncbi:MAG: FAD:protein FMN transferase [Proteobacteria bacterium]|nr:FAD:protein FMN transferase [Pseudomonadota bacterium]
MKRRRFLQIAAAAAALPDRAMAETTWQSVALGADVSVTLSGNVAEAEAAIAGTQTILRQMEAEFSLFDPESTLARLNRAGRLTPDPEFRALCEAADHAHHLTGGLFDPTIQPLWLARAAGLDEGAASESIGWNRVSIGDEVRLGEGQALSFNGIAQGYATDRVRDFLRARGFGRALINIGEFAALGGPFDIGISDPDFGLLGRRHLSSTAMATSSPYAMRLSGGSHILGPKGETPLWSTVSVEADRATLADALSTALVFLDLKGIKGLLRAAPEVRSVTLISREGDLSTLSA